MIEYLFISVNDVTEAVSFEQKLLETNMSDALTGVNNRRCLEIRLKEEVERHVRYNHPLSLIMFDIDFFKRVNDTYGHQCGDFILQSVSSEIKKTIRKGDILARYGGEEFCCVLPETAIEGATLLAERFRKNIEDKTCPYHEFNVKVTISLGVAPISAEVSTPETLMRIADQRLYKAKESGRNRVIASE